MGRGIRVEKSMQSGNGDGWFVWITVFLATTGLAFLYSASGGYAQLMNKSTDYFFIRQAWYLLPAIGTFLFLAFIPIDLIRRYIALIFFISLCVLMLTFIPGIGVQRNNATRWIGIGNMTFQPSELFKPAIILYATHIFSKNTANQSDLKRASIPVLMVTLIGSFVIYIQNDFSTALIVVSCIAVMFWIANYPISFFLGFFSIVIPLGLLSVLVTPFRLRRIIGFLFPNYAPTSIGYQLLGSLKAIRSGGFLGKGLGLGTVKLTSIPEVQSDFVFSAFTEETGYLGVVIFVFIWIVFIVRAYRISICILSRTESDGFERYGFKSRHDSLDLEKRKFISLSAFGLTTLLFFQVLINVGVVSGIVPSTGISLPFYSAAGSSLLATSAICGLLFNFSRSVDWQYRKGSTISGSCKNMESLND